MKLGVNVVLYEATSFLLAINYTTAVGRMGISAISCEVLKFCAAVE
jgi:hypothetical protein